MVQDFGAIGTAGGGVAEATGALDVFAEPLLVKKGIGVGGMSRAKLVEKILQTVFVGREGVSVGRAGCGWPWR